VRLVVGLLTCISFGGLAQALASDQAPQGSPLANQLAPASPSASAGSSAPARPSAPASSSAAASPGATTSQSALAPQSERANQPAAASSTATPGASPAATAQSRKTPELTQAEKDLLARGYKLEMRGPDKHFCRNEGALGTRFTKKVCVTPEEVAAAEANAKDSTRQSQRVGFDYQKGGVSPSGR